MENPAPKLQPGTMPLGTILDQTAGPAKFWNQWEWSVPYMATTW